MCSYALYLNLEFLNGGGQADYGTSHLGKTRWAFHNKKLQETTTESNKQTTRNNSVNITKNKAQGNQIITEQEKNYLKLYWRRHTVMILLAYMIRKQRLSQETKTTSECSPN